MCASSESIWASAHLHHMAIAGLQIAKPTQERQSYAKIPHAQILLLLTESAIFLTTQVPQLRCAWAIIDLHPHGFLAKPPVLEFVVDQTIPAPMGSRFKHAFLYFVERHALPFCCSSRKRTQLAHLVPTARP